MNFFQLLSHTIRVCGRRVSTSLRVFGQRSYKAEPTELNLTDMAREARMGTNLVSLTKW